MRARTVSKSLPPVAPSASPRGVAATGERQWIAQAERLDSWLVTDLLLEHGLLILFGLIAMESAGVPLPGETALIAAGVLAHRGEFHSIEVGDRRRGAGRDHRRQRRLLDRAQGRAGAAAADADRPRRVRARAAAVGAVLRAPRRQDGVLRSLRRVSPHHVGLARGDQPHAVVAVLLLECARRNRLGDGRRRSSHTSSARRPRKRSTNTVCTARSRSSSCSQSSTSGFGSGRSECSKTPEP